MKNLLSALAILFLLVSPVWSAQKTVTVGTSGSPASLDTNFGNIQDNFTEVYTAQDSIRWQDATAYTTADKAIIWNNEIYACKANHLSSAGTEPGAGASWEDAWVVKGSDAYAALGHDHNGVYLESEVDGSVTNEIQTLSIDANLLTLSKDGGTITIPSGGSASAINDLTDVNTTGKSTGKVLKFDASGNLVVGNDEIGAAGTGDITGVTAGTGLTGGGDTGDVTVSLSATNVSAIAANTAKVSFDSTASTRLANTSGANTGDQTIPTTLSALSEDVTHRLVTDTEKSTWNAKSTFDGAYGSLTGTPTIPTLTSDLTNDSGFLGSNPNIGIATGTSLTVTGSLNVPAFTGTTYSGTDVAAAIQTTLTELDSAANATATTYILTLFDDEDAATARTTLGVDPIGTDNSDNNAVNTLYSGLVSNVTTTMDGITPGTGVVNALGNAVNGASGVVVLAASPGTPDGTKVLRDDGTWVANGTVSSESSSYDFVYYDVQATDTGYIFRVPTGATPVWDTAYSWCDGAEAALVYTVYYSAAFGGTFSSLGTIAHNAAAETDSVDISSFTEPSAGGWLRVDITTPGTTASKCTLSIEVD